MPTLQDLNNAIFNNDLSQVRRLLRDEKIRKVINTSLPRKEEGTVLHQAIRGNNDEIVRKLVKYGARVDIPDSNLDLPLHLSAVSDKRGKITQLLLVPALINARNDQGKTPLILAIESGNSVIIDLLLNKANANPNVADNNGYTALHHVITTPNIPTPSIPGLISNLIQKGANCHLRFPPKQMTALMRAMSLRYHYSKETVNDLIGDGSSINQPDQSGLTALHYAAKNPYSGRTMIPLLIAKGANINLQFPPEKLTPLMEALKNLPETASIVDYFLSHPSINFQQTDVNNNSLLYYTEKYDSTLTKKILKQGFNINLQTPPKNETELMKAISLWPKSKPLLQLLLEHNPDLTKTNTDGKTLIDYFFTMKVDSSVDSDELSTLILKNLKDPNGKIPPNEETLLMRAFKYWPKSEPFIMKILQMKNIHLNATDSEGKSLAFYARDQDKTGRLLNQLFKLGVDPRIPTKEGITIGDLSLSLRETDNLAVIEKVLSELRSIPDPYQTFKQERREISATSHIMGLGETSLKRDDNGIEVPYPSGGLAWISFEGYRSHLALEHLHEGVKDYLEHLKTEEKSKEKGITETKTRTETKATKESPSKIDSAIDAAKEIEWIQELTVSTKLALDFSKMICPPKTLLEHYQHHGLMSFSVSFPGHVVGLALYENYLIYTNRGAGERKELSIFKLTEEEKKNINEDFINKLFPKDTKPSDQEIIKHLSSHCEAFKNKNPLTTCIQKDQRHGTCSYVNVKAIREPWLLIKKMEQIAAQSSKSSDLSALTPLDIERARHYAKKQYKKWTGFDRDNYTRKLLEKLSAYRKLGSAGKERYELVLKQIQAILKEHHGQWKITKRPEKIEGELHRALMMLKALTPTERKQVLSALKPKEHTAFLKAIRHSHQSGHPLRELELMVYNPLLDSIQSSNREELEPYFATLNLFPSDDIFSILKEQRELNRSSLMWLARSEDVRSLGEISNIFKKLEPKQIAEILSQKDSYNHTALMMAAQYGKSQSVEMILKELENLDPNIAHTILNIQNSEGKTAKMLAFDSLSGTKKEIEEVQKLFQETENRLLTKMNVSHKPAVRFRVHPNPTTLKTPSPTFPDKSTPLKPK